MDGLDEMDPLGAAPRRARAAVDQLNRAPWRGQAIILTCRQNEYDSLRELRPGGDAGLHAATAVTVLPLELHEVCTALNAFRSADGLEEQA